MMGYLLFKMRGKPLIALEWPEIVLYGTLDGLTAFLLIALIVIGVVLGFMP